MRNHIGACRWTAFSLIEILIVIVVIIILSSLLIPQITRVKESAQISVARQQQAELQTALGSWVAAKSAEPGGLAAARAAYTGSKLTLLRNYLQESTYNSLSGSGDTVTSAALDSVNASLEFSDWPLGGQPTVEWKN